MRKIILLVFIGFFLIKGYAQDFSNKGKDFWVGYGNHIRMFNAGTAETMQIYLTSDVNTTGNITISSVGFNQNFTVTANQITVVNIPRSAALLDEGLYNHGIHITALKPVVAYGFIYVNAISGATVFLPTNTLGKDYYTLNYTQVSNEPNSYSYFFVEAVETGTTTIEITPSQTTKGGWPANVKQTINLTQGQIYQVLSATDLTGSIIKTVASGSGGCKKVAVFCGSGKINIASAGGSADNLYQQMYPASTWGKKYVLIPSINKQAALPAVSINTNFFRVYRPDPTTTVTLNGVIVPGASFINNYYQFSSNATNLVDADKPILVSQYFTTQGVLSNQNPHDPEMIYLNPVEQTVTDVTVNSMQPTVNTNINQHFINVVLRNAGTGISSFKIDGVTPNATVNVLLQDNSYAYLRINYNGNTTNPLTSGAHHLTCDSGFNAIAYGFGQTESYGYSAGTNLKDLYQQIGVSTQYGIETTPSVCTGSPFKFKVSLPYCADSIRWNLNNLPGPPAVPPTIIYSTCTPGFGGPDSTTSVNGKTLYWYNLPTTYTFGTVGLFPVTITTYTTTASTCGSEQDIDFDLQISDPPIADFTWRNNGCVTDSIRFTDATVTAKPLYKWWWDFGEPSSGVNNNSVVKNPVHKYANAGTYTVRYTNVTTPGCLSDTISKQVFITNVPNALFGMSTPICAGMPVIFSDTSSLVAPGSLTNWHWNFGDGFIITRTNNSDTTHIYSPWNPSITDTLIVETNSGCRSLPFYRTFKVNPKPVSNFTLPAGICLPADSARFVNTSTIADATTGFGYLWDFGDPASAPNNTSVLQNPAHYYNNAGPFNINLTTTSAAGCVHDTTKILSNVYPQAIAGVTVNAENCLNSITSFTDNSTGSGNTVTQWFWDFGDGSPIDNTQNPTHTYVTAGIKIIKHWIKTNVGCTSDTATSTVTINPLPTANFTSTGPFCVTKDVTFTNTSVPNAGNIINWNWDLGDGTIVNYNNGNPFTHQYAITGTYIAKLIVTTDKGCVSPVKTVDVIVQPLPVPSFTSSIECLPYGVAVFTNTSTIANASAMSYQWNFGDVASGANNTSTLPNPSHYFSTVGPYTVTLTATSVPEGCITTSQQVVSNIYPQPGSAFTVAAENCLNTATIFTSNGNGNGSTVTEYHWDFGDATTGTGNTVSHTYATAGTKIIKHWIVTDKGCYSDTTQHTVVVNPLPTADFTYSTPECATRLISFTDVSVPNAGILNTWQWDFGDGSPLSNTTNPTHIFTTAGTYNVTLSVSSTKGCISNPIANKAVIINARPLAGFITPEVCLSDTYAQFLDTSKVALPGNVVAWQWNFGDPFATVPNPNTSILQNPTHSYTAVGPYSIQLIATTNTGCKDTLNQTLTVNGSFPVANFTVNNPTTLCANDSVAIVEASTVFPGNITKVEIYWDNINFPAGPPQVDDLPFTGKVYRHLYLPNSQLTKTYQIRYRAYSGGICVNDKLSTITVNAAPKVQFTSLAAVCYDAPQFQLTQGSEIGGVPGTFAYSGPGIINPNGLFNPVTAGVGTHSIKYTFTSAIGGCVDTISQTIKVLDTASAKFSFVSPVCEGTAATFIEESTAPAGVILANTTWNFGDGSPAESHAPGSTFTHAFPGWGSYTITMYTTSAYGCKSASKVQQIYISPIPKTSFSFAQNSVCLPNASVSFVNNSTIADGTENSFTYAWNFGDPASGILNTSTAKTPAPHIYTGTGPYTVTLTVTSGSNCNKTITQPVDFIHPQPKAAFNFNKPEVCIKDIVVFRDLSNGLDGTVQQWNWNFGDGSLGTLAVEPHLYAAANTYDVSLFIVNSRGCNSDTITKQFTVHPYPVVDAGPDRVVLQGGVITIQSIATGNDLKYLWTPATYINATDIPSPTASNLQDSITYTLTVTARGGCKSSDDMFVKVLKAPKVPNTFTPNGDGINEFWLIEYLDTYPDNRVQVFTRTGQLVFESKGYKTPWNGKINGKPLPFDTYYYIIEPGSGRQPVTGYVTIVK